jgi:energy-coupling factor transporter transmembrane protein EcfT
MRELRLMRYVPVDSPVHRLWAGTKLVVIVAFALVLAVRPTFTAEGFFAALLGAAFAASRVPRSVFPRVPRWIWLPLAIFLTFSLGAGGPPVVHIGPPLVRLAVTRQVDALAREADDEHRRSEEGRPAKARALRRRPLRVPVARGLLLALEDEERLSLAEPRGRGALGVPEDALQDLARDRPAVEAAHHLPLPHDVLEFQLRPPVAAALAAEESLIHQAAAQPGEIVVDRAERAVDLALRVVASLFEARRETLQQPPPQRPRRRGALQAAVGAEEPPEDGVVSRFAPPPVAFLHAATIAA